MKFQNKELFFSPVLLKKDTNVQGYYFSLCRFPRLEDSLMEQISFRDFINVFTVAQLVFTVKESYLM